MKSKIKKIKFIISIFLSFLILYFVFSKFDFGEIKTVFIESKKLVLLLSILLLFSLHPLFVLRWKIGLSLLGFNGKYRDVFMVYLANLPIAKISPAYSGDFVRALYFKDKIEIGKSMGLVFMEVVADVLALATAALVGGIIFGAKLPIIIGVSIIISIICFFLFIDLINNKIPKNFKNKIDNFFTIFSLINKNQKVKIRFIALTLLMIFILLLYIKISFLAFGENVPILMIFAYYPVVNFISLAPVTLWGIGVRETAMVYFFGKLISENSALAVGLTFSSMGAVFFPLLSLPFFILMFNKIKLLNN
ncbi:MAG: hypothetical protein US83_C0003G0101 [Candidatus Falkowbacteria bacterium GW2011_GWC2_38_22]|uniref:Lysylphosphatidylglycerol synthetase/UPF0104 n=1 Tax=Candidatus Falkowbacteria bacterium GW2011_GWE1_38_31 TaxID=1618638 RepID=A0A0G0N2C6_9BACT|nr:MAG: hypothetical protein US73_C0001G0193 [Candidatus Falkowbacteria bacterium GW2011_GWF2_38_1205]KKQ61852.1 MAG: hypothetical protein US83_C0003G0101 [Candidatus Falkowbacteria bacterium GW2011_GWC2_38_22]KKQ64160.1 MAG: hypothetical protein US84_C0002G0192 [Candidatus Falkowbacteria bacterium GW2011_GWF1_38_22]KKQ66490.1 MAG: hypothetical protein US87_C0001G0011 [Candidatus Falkowbacteria bacterium GW2011_GWE2_38_254]KKQ71266.1 MAG: hypothetical protein US91_C0001G0193 [Candidatus Falkowb